jgi:hypothetical protein
MRPTDNLKPDREAIARKAGGQWIDGSQPSVESCVKGSMVCVVTSLP